MEKDFLKISMYEYLKNNNPNPDRTALRFLYKSISFRRLFREIDLVAGGLLSLGLQRGDCITVALPNVPAAISVFYAANRLGLKVNLVHPLTPVKQLRTYMKTCESTVLIGFDKILNKQIDALLQDEITIVAAQAQDAFPWLEKTAYGLVTFHQRSHLKGKVYYLSRLKKAKVSLPPVAPPSDCAVIMHSGGTTEVPKSIMLSDFNFNCVAFYTRKVLPTELTDADGMLAVLPMFHAFGLGVCIHTSLSNGVKVILIPKYSPKRIAQKMRTEDVSLMAGVPTMYAGILAQKGFRGKKLKKLKFAFCGGDKLSPKLKHAFDERLRRYGSECVLDEGYGLTEATGVFSVNTRKASKSGTVGQPLGDYEIEAFDTACGKCLPRGTEGELCICASTVMTGYWKDAAATETAKIRHNGKDWLRTGDFGSVDENGFISFHQRIKRIVKVSGVPVFPSEVETKLASLPYVQNCCVVGIPDAVKGSVLKAYVVLQVGENAQLRERDLDAYAKSRFNKWEYPRKYEFCTSLPLTAFGKPDYRALERQNTGAEK